ncbi:serine protease [Streptomyces sp. NBC_01549]|uniref:hypothetical protein n=1 Tax=unclassified Streptomyces TaxID=2593676 RepID=UPI002257D627|nr:hypothetical protein [Streptomyces sp. NBC_01549]MCX4596968.1 serine protease [Streptomyces sp. NBC_01549]
MAGGTASRAVEVINQDKESYGTGCLLAPGLVLTALHVAKPGGGSVVKVRDTASATFTEAVAVWQSSELDAVLLTADRARVGADVRVVRFGELVCDYPDRRPVCTMTGFPKAMRRRMSANPDRYVDDLKTVDGRIAPHTGSRSKVYALEVDGAVPTEVKNWQGLSGAGVFCDGLLVGIATLVDQQWDRSVLARPLSHLLTADNFATAVTAHTGMPPRLLPADLTGLLTLPPAPTLSSSHLLDPRSQVVGLTGMTGLIDQIERWCQGTPRVDVAAVTGLGGTGKSRLVTEVLARLTAARARQRPWSGGFLAETPVHTEYGMLASSPYPLFIAVDVAEARDAQIRDVARALAEGNDGATVRVLLLARTDGIWWPRLRRDLRAQQVGPVNETFLLAPDDALADHSPEDIYVEAKAAFAHRIRLLQQAGHGDDTWRETVVADAPRRYGADITSARSQPVIYHHIAALADVLARANPDFARNDHPMEVLLANEENYVRRVAEARLGTDAVDTKLLRTLVVAQFLAGAPTARDGRAAVRASFDVHHHGYGTAALPDRSQLAALDDVLTAAYPATDGAHWGAIGEPLATALLADVETDSGNEFVEHFLQHDRLTQHQCHQALSTVVRTAGEQPDLADGALRAVAANPELLLPLAVQTIATELDVEHTRQWLAELEDAVADRATQPNADPDTYEWASDLIADAQTRAASGARGLEELVDELSHGEQEEDSESQREPASGEGEGESPAPASRPHRVLVKDQVSWPARAVITLVALCHLILVGGVAFTAGGSPGLHEAGWSRWMFPLMIFSANLAIASLYGSHQVDKTAFFTWIGPPFVVAMTTLSALIADLPLPPPWPPWILWPVVFSGGLYSLTFAWRIWIGQFKELDEPASYES